MARYNGNTELKIVHCDPQELMESAGTDLEWSELTALLRENEILRERAIELTLQSAILRERTQGAAEMRWNG